MSSSKSLTLWLPQSSRDVPVARLFANIFPWTMPPAPCKKKKKIPKDRDEEADPTFTMIWDHKSTLVVSSPNCSSVNEI